MENLTTLTEAIEWDDETLYDNVALFLLGDSMGMAPPTASYMRHLALHWLKRETARYKDLVCTSSKVKNFLDSESHIEVIGKAILDTLITQMAPVPALFLATYILRAGIRSLCNEDIGVQEHDGTASAN